MMLTPEQLEYLRGMRFEESCGGLSVGSDAIVAHIDAQQARIAELEQGMEMLTLLANTAHQSAHAAGMNAGEDITKLPAVVAELAQDAARYRWCKDNPDNAASVFDNLGPAYFDSEIDMLMQK